MTFFDLSVSEYFLGNRLTSKADTREAEPMRTKGPIQDSLNKTGNSRLPITAPNLPTIITKLTAIVLKHVGKLSTIMLSTQAPPILDMATKTELNPRILSVLCAQYKEPQQAAATMKQVAMSFFFPTTVINEPAKVYPTTPVVAITIELMNTLAFKTAGMHTSDAAASNVSFAKLAEELLFAGCCPSM